MCKYFFLKSFYIFVLTYLLFPCLVNSQDYQVQVVPEQITEITRLSFSADGKYIVTSETGENAHIKIWDQYFRLKKAFPLLKRKTQSLAISPNGRFVANALGKNEIEIWDTEREKKIVTLQNTVEVESMLFSPDGRQLAVCGSFIMTSPKYGGFGQMDKSRVIDVFDFSKAEVSGEIFRSKISFNGYQCQVISYSPDGKYLLGTNMTEEESNLMIWNATSGKKVKFITVNDTKSFLTAQFIPNSDLIIYNQTKYFHIVNFKTGQEIKKIYKERFSSSSFDVNKKGQLIYPTTSGFEMKDINTDDILWKVNLQKEGWLMDFHPTKPLLFIRQNRSAIQVWNYEEQKHLFDIISVDHPEGFLLLSPQGHYHGSKEGVKALVVQKDGKTYPFEEFDLILNRPVKIFASLPDIDPQIIAQYQRLEEERTELMGKEKNEISNLDAIPQIQIINKNKLPDTIIGQAAKINLVIKMKDTMHSLTQLNVFVNKVPVLGTVGETLNTNKDIISTIPITLSNGENIIEVSVRNEKGRRSLTDQVTITYLHPSFKQKMNFIGVGISEYMHINSLNYAHKDIKDIADYLMKNAGDHTIVSTKTLLNEAATQSAILALKNELRDTKVDDIILLYFAGHGGFNDQGKWCFMPHDYNTGFSGITDDLINKLLAESPSRKKVIIIDACHAGEVFGKKKLKALVMDTSGRTRGAVEDGADEDEQLDEISLERLKEVFNDIRNETGTVVIAASGSRERAMEGEGHDNGVFTYFFLKALNTIVADTNFDQNLSVSELMAYVYDEVLKVTGGKQRPNFKKTNTGLDFNLWHRERKKVDYDKLFDGH